MIYMAIRSKDVDEGLGLRKGARRLCNPSITNRISNPYGNVPRTGQIIK